MKNNFSDKLNDFTEWSKTAFTHFNNGFYADSLTNMRKSGEAACKIIFLHKFSERISENKIGHKNYKELIELVIKDNLAPRKVINWLETLQIHGNEATHDTRIMQEQSYYGIIALRLLIYWIYIEFLKSTVPTSLQKEISQIKVKSNDIINNKKIEDERSKLIKEKEELEKKLIVLKGKESQENEKITSLTNELNNSVTKIKELDTAQHKIVNLEKELMRYKIEAEELKQKQSTIVVPKKKNLSRIIVIALLSVILIIIGIFVINNIRTHSGNVTSEKANAEIIKQQTDSFKVLVFPFIILQDNPNIKLNIEDALVNHIRQKSQDMKLPLQVIYKSVPNISVLSKTDLFNIGVKENANVVLYGELYEPVNNDSTQVNIKDILIRDKKPTFDETGIQAFNKLSDSTAIKIIQSVECNIYFTIAEDYVSNKMKHSEALALLYNTVPITKSQKGYYCNFLAECHVALKNYNAAIIELEKYIELEPTKGYPYAFLANVYKRKREYDKAEIYYKKSLQIEPNNINTLQNYSASLMSKDFKNKHKARALLLEAIKLDSTNANTWYYLAELENMTNDYKAAKKYYIKFISMKPDFIEAKTKLATMLAFKLDEPEIAVDYINSILLKDSNEVKALFLLANIYTNTKIKNLKKAEYLFKKCNGLTKGVDASETDMGLGFAAFEKGDFNTALTYFLKAYSVKNNDAILCSFIGQTYMTFKDYVNVEKYFKLALELDSLNNVTNYNMGYFYLFAEGKFRNLNKAVFYFDKGLKTNPYDILTIQWLGNIYAEQKNIVKMREIRDKLQTLTPNNSYLYKLSGYLAEFDNDEKKALSHYKKAIQISPNDEESNYKVAYLTMKLIPTKSWKEALISAERVIALNPNNPNNQYIYSKVLIYCGEYRKGIEHYNKAKEIDPTFIDDETEELIKKGGY